ncbi:hypothetical protein XOCgx_2941 [Xanthomonas oryzae pv. oryzicola]|nr:hypothetical protein XOCgx_2941 [Xanthomonas oryzae pv. oryzicola]
MLFAGLKQKSSCGLGLIRNIKDPLPRSSEGGTASVNSMRAMPGLFCVASEETIAKAATS